MIAPYGPRKLWLDSEAALLEALAVIEAYSTLLECACGIYRQAGLTCEICGRVPSAEEISEEEPPPKANRAACPPPPSLSSP